MSDAPTRGVSPDGDATADPTADPDATKMPPRDRERTPSWSGGPFASSQLITPPGYELLEKVGSGGMGVVYRARDIALDRDVAVKFLQNRYAADSPHARRFVDEARITAQLQHPGIPPIHQVGTLPDGRPFLAMKLIKGETLADQLAFERDRTADRGRFVVVFALVCQAVAYAHAHKVIHRDLKPANVMVGAFGEVQVMDWGLAKVLASGERQPPDIEATEPDERTEIRSLRDADLATQAGSVLGTPAFMAPEQAQGAVDEIDERADVFGLGAVLCAILTGKPAYSASNSDFVRLMSIRGETADAFARLDACGADPGLVELCKRCLAAKREDRPRDAAEVAQEVTGYLALAEERARQAELDAVRAEGERATAEAKAAEEANTRREADARLAEQRKRRRVQLALAGSVLLLLALVAVGIGLGSLWQTARQAQGEAESARDQLTDEKKLTEEARDDAEKARKRLEVFEYGRTIQVAHQDWRDGNFIGALALLDGTNPKLRDWEWHYVHRLCNGSLLTLKGHTDSVTSASFSPDGSRIVTGSGHTARVWDAKTGAELLALKGHVGRVRYASLSPDGSRIVTSRDDETAWVWDAKTGAELLTLKGHTSVVTSALFNPDSTRIVTGSWDHMARVWDAKTGAELLTLKGHTSAVTSASFSPDGTRILTRSEDETARMWDAKTGAELLTLKGHVGRVSFALFSPDGSRIVTGSGDHTARVWDAKTGAEVLTLNGHTSWVSFASFSPDGSRIVTGSRDKTARVWDAGTGAELLTLKGHTDGVLSASFSPDGSRIVTGSGDKTVKVWDAGPLDRELLPKEVAPAPREK